MAGLIEDSIRASPEQIAIGVADGSLQLSYRELGKLAHTLAGRLTKAGIGPDQVVGLYCDNGPEFVLAMLAAWSVGAAVVPIDPQLATPEVRARLAATGAGVVLLPERLLDNYPAGTIPAWPVALDTPASLVTLTTDSGRPAAPDAGSVPGAEVAGAGDSRPALIMFTTGSTGTAKIVPLSHANLAASVAGICATYHLARGDATLLVMPLFHGHGLIAGLLATLASGGAAYLPATGRFSAHRFWGEITNSRATWYTAVPTIHQILLARAPSDYPADRPPALRFIRSCSAPLAPAVLRNVEQQFGAPVISAYGMTETAHQATSNPLPADGPRKESSVGVPTGGLQVRLVTDTDSQAGPGVTGEVCVRGPAVTGGYLGDVQATGEAFAGGWFRTGDLGLLDSDGYLFLTGRTKDMINRGGEKIAPHVVEAVLLAHPAVYDALAFAVPDPKYGEEVNAAVILRPGQRVTETALQAHCGTQLSAFEIPKKIYFLDRFPRTTKGDGDRRALAATLNRNRPAS